MVTIGHEASIDIGVQSTAYTGHLDEKWEITIGGGLMRKFLFNHFIRRIFYGTASNYGIQNVNYNVVYNKQNNR